MGVGWLGGVSECEVERERCRMFVSVFALEVIAFGLVHAPSPQPLLPCSVVYAKAVAGCLVFGKSA